MVFLDTSVLVKWFVNEPWSEDVRDFVVAQEKLTISRLSVAEFASALARRRRSREITPTYERAAMRAFRHDMAQGVIRIEPLNDGHAILAAELIAKLRKIPLRTLDALQLACAIQCDASLMATADRVMADAARKLKLSCRFFGGA